MQEHTHYMAAKQGARKDFTVCGWRDGQGVVDWARTWLGCGVIVKYTQSLQFIPDQMGNVLVFFGSAYKHPIVTVLGAQLGAQSTDHLPALACHAHLQI